MQSRSRIKVSLCLGLISLTGYATQSTMAAGPIVISQLFGGGGQIAAGPNGDFVEIFNRSCVAVNLDGYSVQVAGSVSSSTWSVVQLPNFQLDPGKYYCIRMTTTAVGTPFQHDQLAGIASGDLMLANSGKAAIVVGNTALNVACPPLASVVDFVRFENVSSACTEGNSVATAGALTGSGRGPSRRLDVDGDGVGDGCQDTDNNSADFVIDAQPCVPRNNASPANNCPGAPVFGGCSLESGPCIVTANAAACLQLGGNYLGDCTPCVAPQACCLPTTPVTCVVQSEQECALDGGVFNPGSFSCPPANVCPLLGRCCSPDGTCVVTFAVNCQSPNVYAGDGTNCNGTPCQGRCCGVDGSCNVVGPALCVAPSTFGGVGTDCALPQLCQGRCCEPDGDCTLTGVSNCLAPNTFGGVGSTCADVHSYTNAEPQIIPVGGATPPSIISVPDGFAVQDVDVQVKIQHVWRADVVICLSAPDGTVVSLTQAASCTVGGLCGGEDNINAIFDDEGLPVNCASPNLANLAAVPDRVISLQPLSILDGIPATGDWTLNIFDDVAVDSGTLLEWTLLLDSGDACKGACCLPTTACIRIGQAVCLQQGGTFNGNGTQCSPSPCAPNGACCIGGTCSLQSAIDCGINNGVFGGVNSDCTSPPCFVPCCKHDGSCSQMTLAACAALPFAQPGDLGDPCSVPCAAVGACCYEDGTCETPRTEYACTTGPNAGGVRWTAGGSCVPNLCRGQCCHIDGTCTVEFPDDCIAPSSYAGDGTDCSNPNGCIGACCNFNGGECTMEGPGNCLAPNIFNGVGVTCAQVQCSGRCCGGGGACSVTSPGQCAGTFTIGQSCDPVQTVNFDNVNLLIPLGLPAPGGYGPVATNVQTVSGITGNITDVDVGAVVQHTWSGDVKIDVEHLGVVVTIVDLMGHPLPDAGGCGTDNFDVIIDDEGAGGPIETQCNTLAPAAASPPNFTPESEVGVPYTAGGLSAFDGLDPNGDWTISVSDGYDLDSGTLLSWSLSVSFVGQVCPSTACTCFGDMNGDGGVSGRDVLLFAQCVAAGGAGCPCGDMNHAGGATAADVPAFVTSCLTGTCGTP